MSIDISTISGYDTNKLFFIYINSNGIGGSIIPWDIISKTCPLSTIYWNGTLGLLCEERHGAIRNLAWHKYAHETLGTAYRTGLNATFTSASTLISSGIIEDEDIIINISSQTKMRIWSNAVGNLATTFMNYTTETSAHIITGVLQYDFTGTTTPVTNGYFVKNYIYATNDIDYPISVIVSQSQYSNINDARNGEFPTFPSYISAETRLIYTTIWQNIGGVATFIESADFRTAKTAPNGILGKRATYLGEIEDVIITTPSVDDTLRFNGANWITGPTPTSAGAGVSFYYATPSLTGSTTNNTNPISTLSKTPVTTTEQTTSVSIAISGSLIMSAWLYNTSLGKTSIDAGTWNFPTYAGVSSVGGGRVSTITHNIYSVLHSATTIYVSGSGASRTVTSLDYTPFTITNISASTTNTNASYLQTPQGLYQISARTSDNIVTILTPTTYVNETATTFSIWKRLFSAITPTITAISPSYALYTATSTQGTFTITTDTKIGAITFGTSNNTTSRVITMSYDGNSRNSYFTTPLVITHNQLANLQGGISDEYYHLTLSEYNATLIAVPNNRTINNYTLTSNITLSLSDISNTSHTHSWNQVTSTPTTISGYGISDTYTQTEIDTKILWEKGVGNLSVKTKGTACAANNNYSVATGFITTANGIASNAQNQSTVASGNYSNAAGLNTVASGTFAFSEGFETAANGVATHAAGEGTIAHDYAEFVIGKYNIPGTSTGTTGSLFTIGNGINIHSKSNAFQIKSDGTIIITQPVSAATDSFLTIDESGIVTKKSFDTNYNQLKLKNTYTVSETGGDFTVISDVFNFVNNLAGDFGITIILDAGDHYLEDSYTINSSHKITFKGAGSNCCNVIEADELGYNLLNILTPVDFNGINFVGFAKTSNCIFIDQPVYCEILNCNFKNFATSIITNQGDLFIHNFVIDNCVNGIMADDGSNGYYNKIDAEVGNFINCEQGIYLKAGKNSIFEIYNCVFSPGYGSSNIGIVYNSDYYSYSDHPSIQGCKWDNTGHFLDGFDFTRHDGRDKNIVIQNNVGSEDKTPHAYLNMINNTSATNLGNNTWTKLNYTGTTVYENKIYFTGNRFTYQPTNVRDLMVWGSGTLTTSTQISNIELVIVKNGNTGLLSSPILITLDSNSRKFQWSANAYIPAVKSDDYFEIWGMGIGSAETVILEDLNLLITSL